MARLRPAPIALGPDADGVPVEFHDLAHPLWTGPSGPFIDYMNEHGWHLPAMERFAHMRDVVGDGTWRGSPPERRRQAAVVGWALEVGITSPKWPSNADYHRLRAMGLLTDRGSR